MFSQLSADVIDTFLTALPDFATLLSTILVSKEIYVVFETRPNSIIRAVAENQVGAGVLPQALRVVRLEHDAYQKSEAQILLSSLPEEEDVLAQRITRQEARALAINAHVADGLEALFSIRHKDIKTNASQLSSVESLRFKCALYRCWLFCRLFARRQHDEEGEDDQDAVEDYENSVKIFNAFQTSELAAIIQFQMFLDETVTWNIIAAGNLSYADRDMMLAQGPAIILECFETGSLESHMDGGVMRVQNLPEFSARNAYVNHHGVVGSISAGDKIILDKIEGELDECDECHSKSGTSLWCTSRIDWHLLEGHFYIANILDCLPGHLFRNHVETLPLVHRMGPPYSFSDLIKDCVQSDTYDWSGGLSLCFECVRKLLGKHLMQWLIQQKVQNNIPTHEDCWYGYNCRTQSHRYTHAAKLNHLCEPTRGDPA